MKQNIYFQSTLRQPLHTLFMLLLTGVISFAFTARIAEYLIVQREIERLGDYYRSIGILLPIDADDPDVGFQPVTKGAEVIAASQYLDFEDRVRMVAGVLEDMYNVDLDGVSSDTYQFGGYGIHVSDVFVYGTLTGTFYNDSNGTGLLYLSVDQVEAGYPEYVKEGQQIYIQVIPEYVEDVSGLLDRLETGERYFVKAYYDSLHTTGQWQQSSRYLLMKPLNHQGLFFIVVPSESSVDYGDPALAGLEAELKVLQENQRTLRVVSTADMSAMPRIQEAAKKLRLIEGRWLNREDNLDVNQVAIVSSELALRRGLSLGDTLRLTLRDNQDLYGYIPDSQRGNWEKYSTQEVEFEIVGLFEDSNLGSNQNLIFIPDSCLPSEYGGDKQTNILSGTYSFVLKSSRDQNAFVVENRVALAALGLRISFVDNNANNFWTSAIPLQRSATVNVWIFSGVQILTLVLVVFLYLRQRRREFVILRALGKPAVDAAREMLVPITLLGAVGILTGGLASWQYALRVAANTLAAIQGPQGTEASVALSPMWLLAICGGAFLLLLLFVYTGTQFVTRRPVLVLLQGSGGQKLATAQVESREAVGQHSPHNFEIENQSIGAAFHQEEFSLSSRGFGLWAALLHILRHIRRAPLKSILTAAMAMSFSLALGWMNGSIQGSRAEVERLYATTPVNMEIVKEDPNATFSGALSFIGKKTVDRVLESGFAQSAYLESAVLWSHFAARAPEGEASEYPWDENRSIVDNVRVQAINQAERFFQYYNNYQVEYAAGWNESLFSKEWGGMGPMPLILSVDYMDELGVTFGDQVYMLALSVESPQIFLYEIVGRSMTKPQYQMPNQSLGNGPILVPLSAMHFMAGDALHYTVAEFVLDPSLNQELPQFKKEMQTLVSRSDAGRLNLRLVVWDEELREVAEPMEKNIALLSVLYPVTIALSVVIGAVLALLLMLQNAKEAAVMRILGTTRRKTQFILCGIQLIPCLLGLLLGLGILSGVRGDLSAGFAGISLLCAGLYLAGALLGAVFASLPVTNRMPLELLQVKE